jgi:hypothetical protein
MSDNDYVKIEYPGKSRLAGRPGKRQFRHGEYTFTGLEKGGCGIPLGRRNDSVVIRIARKELFCGG